MREKRQREGKREREKREGKRETEGKSERAREREG